MKKSRDVVFDRNELYEMLLRDAKAVGIPKGAAEVIAKSVVGKVTNWVETKPVITQDDLYRKIAKEAEKYNQDLAYVYQNRGKII